MEALVRSGQAGQARQSSTGRAGHPAALRRTRSQSESHQTNSQTTTTALFKTAIRPWKKTVLKLVRKRTSLVHPTLKRSVALVDRRSVSQVHPRKPVLMQVPNPQVATAAAAAAAHHTEHDTVGIVSTSIAPLSGTRITKTRLVFKTALCVRLFSFPRPHAEAYHP
ncbi:hypothetical protein QR685DRAFT_596965 [Neurospora intermedia]|uniref:Uncharacterized protein n=1 Tax=Neurospora intermedia TaxID=5142 RepID=A0ABR3DC91_NEUIN